MLFANVAQTCQTLKMYITSITMCLDPSAGLDSAVCEGLCAHRKCVPSSQEPGLSGLTSFNMINMARLNPANTIWPFSGCNMRTWSPSRLGRSQADASICAKQSPVSGPFVTWHLTNRVPPSLMTTGLSCWSLHLFGIMPGHTRLVVAWLARLEWLK